MPYGELSVPRIMPINIVKVYEILQGKATIIMANEFGRIIKNVGGGFFDRTLARLKGSGATSDSRIGGPRSIAKWSGRNDTRDWRVKLTIPTGASALRKALLDNNDLFGPLQDTGGIFWPLTPAVVIQHSANYNALAQTHSNYPFQAYQNSQVDSLNIIGEFPVQNQQDAAHWVATVNFLRTVTKMFFGNNNQELKGNPPPILHMSGYGDHMFQKVPVVINTFNVELRPGIDYISTKQNTVYQGQLASSGSTGRELGATKQFNPNSIDQTWAPTLSNISVLVTPIYSRESIKNFSLQDFARGKLNGKGTGEIGFI